MFDPDSMQIERFEITSGKDFQGCFLPNIPVTSVAGGYSESLHNSV